MEVFIVYLIECVTIATKYFVFVLLHRQNQCVHRKKERCRLYLFRHLAVVLAMNESKK